MHPKSGSNKDYGENKTGYWDGGAWDAPKSSPDANTADNKASLFGMNLLLEPQIMLL